MPTGPGRNCDSVDLLRSLHALTTLCMVLTGVIVFSGIAKAQTGPETPAARNVAYVENGHQRQRLHVYLPATGKNWPLVIWIHGGGWESGNHDYSPARFLVNEGFAVASIGYRLSTDAPFPAQIQDCKSAIRWLKRQAPRFGYNPERVGVWGQSAGGHLASLVGTTGADSIFDVGAHLENKSHVQAVVDFCGPTDLSLYGQSKADDTLGRLIGGPIQNNAAKVKAANPLSYIRKDQLPAFLIVHGDRDNIVPIKHSELLVNALKANGGDVTYHIAKGKQHDVRENDTPQRVTAFFKANLQK